MPSLKPVKSLFDLSLNASCDFVLSAAQKIEKSYPSDSGLSYDAPGCSEAVLSLQAHLRDQLPLTVREPLLQAVLQKVSDWETGISDPRILFSALICDKVTLKKLTLNYRCFTESGSNAWADDADEVMKNQRHVKFWMNQLPMLTNLVELKLGPVLNDEMIIGFVRTCTKLQSLSLYSFEVSVAAVVSALRSISALTKLQKLDCRLFRWHLEELMATSDVEKKWTICNLDLYGVTAEQVNYMMHLCPHLVDLCILTEAGEHEEMLRILASCPQKFTKLSLHSQEDSAGAFNDLLASKGTNIKDLRISCNASVNPLKVLRLVSETCANLTRLYIMSNMVQQDQARLYHDISFPKLEHLGVSTSLSSSQLGSLVVAKRCLESAPKLTSLEIDMWSREVDEQELIQLFTASQLKKQLTDLTITCYRELLSTNLPQNIFKCCTNWKSFTISGVDSDAKRYLSIVKEDIKRKNLDISLKFS